jgi:hypothetical protein
VRQGLGNNLQILPVNNGQYDVGCYESNTTWYYGKSRQRILVYNNQ